MKIDSIKGSVEIVKMSFFRDIYKVNDTIFKVRKRRSDSTMAREGAANDRSYQIEMRKKFDFLPNYYGTIITSIGGELVSISFYEEVDKCGISKLKEILRIIIKAIRKGFVIDPKPSNFGMKGEKVYYVDEFGIGKWIPLDIEEGMKSSFEFLKKIKIRYPMTSKYRFLFSLFLIRSLYRKVSPTEQKSRYQHAKSRPN
jgi:hypothetical protein